MGPRRFKIHTPPVCAAAAPRAHRLTDLCGDSKKAKTYVNFLVRQGNVKAIVEHVFGGSRFKVQRYNNILLLIIFICLFFWAGGGAGRNMYVGVCFRDAAGVLLFSRKLNTPREASVSTCVFFLSSVFGLSLPFSVLANQSNAAV